MRTGDFPPLPLPLPLHTTDLAHGVGVHRHLPRHSHAWLTWHTHTWLARHALATHLIHHRLLLLLQHCGWNERGLGCAHRQSHRHVGRTEAHHQAVHVFRVFAAIVFITGDEQIAGEFDPGRNQKGGGGAGRKQQEAHEEYHVRASEAGRPVGLCAISHMSHLPVYPSVAGLRKRFTGL